MTDSAAHTNIKPGERTVRERNPRTGKMTAVRERPIKAEHELRPVDGVAPSKVLPVVTDLADYVVLEKVIADGDKEERAGRRKNLRGRWKFGRAILAEIPAGKKQLPKGRMDDICREVGKGSTEISYRMAFARLYPTDDAYAENLDQDLTWNQVKAGFGPPVGTDAVPESPEVKAAKATAAEAAAELREAKAAAVRKAKADEATKISVKAMEVAKAAREAADKAARESLAAEEKASAAADKAKATKDAEVKAAADRAAADAAAAKVVADQEAKDARAKEKESTKAGAKAAKAVKATEAKPESCRVDGWLWHLKLQQTENEAKAEWLSDMNTAPETEEVRLLVIEQCKESIRMDTELLTYLTTKGTVA